MDRECVRLQSAELAPEGNLLRSAINKLGAIVGRIFLSIDRFRKRRRDAAIVDAMDDKALKDIGLYSHDLPHPDAISPESRRDDFIMMDGSPFCKKF